MKADRSNQSARSQKPPKLREVCFEDYFQVAALVCKFDLHIESYAGWIRLWTENPAYRPNKHKFPKGWVLETADGAIAGYLGNIPLSYELRGRRLLAATTRAWVVDNPYRSYSPLLLGTYFQQANVDLFLSTTLNSQSTPLYRIFQTSPVPVGIWDRTLFWITHYPGFIESFLRKRDRAMARALSYSLSAGLYLSDQFKGRRLHRHSHVRDVLPVDSFDNRFDAFWEALRKKKYDVLLGVRTEETLTWHFGVALAQKAAWIYTVEGDSGLSAYSVFLRDDYPPIGLTRMRLVDFQCLDDQRAPELLVAMLDAAKRRCRAESIQMLELVGLSAKMEAELQSAAPHIRPLPNWLYFYKTNNPSLAGVLENPEVWEPSLFDGDSSLWSEAMSAASSR